jgi:hypothetical protein
MLGKANNIICKNDINKTCIRKSMNVLLYGG